MANLARVRVSWSGPAVVGPGISTFYFDEAGSGWTADLATFFNVVKAWIPVGTSMTVPNNGDLIDAASGELSGTWTDGSTSVIGGTGVGNYTLGVGCRVVWATAGLTNGRRVKGSTYIVPILNAQFEGSGALVAAFVSSLDSAADALVTAQAGTFVIYTRPVNGAGGKSSAVTAANVPDAVSWLRSRRT